MSVKKNTTNATSKREPCAPGKHYPSSWVIDERIGRPSPEAYKAAWGFIFEWADEHPEWAAEWAAKNPEWGAKMPSKKLAREMYERRQNDWTTLRLATFGIVHQLEAGAALLRDIAMEYSDDQRTALRGLADTVGAAANGVHNAMTEEVHSIDAEAAKFEK